MRPNLDEQILRAIASGQRFTQRSLASELGVALGLTNLLIKRLATKGYVRVSRLQSRQVRYMMTPKGWRAFAKATRQSLENTVHLYTQTREQIRGRMSEIASPGELGLAQRRPIVFYGAGDVAEIAYVSLQGTALDLVAVVDDRPGGEFFGLPIQSPDVLSQVLSEHPAPVVVVTSIRHTGRIRGRLEAIGVPSDRVALL